MTKYVVGTIEPIFLDDNGDEIYKYVKFPSAESFVVEHPYYIDVEYATFFDTKKDAEEMVDVYFEEEEDVGSDDDYYEELFRDELCIYEVDVKVKVKKQVK